MTRLTRKDNDILRRQEWRLLFVPGGGTSSASSTSSATAQGSAFQLHSQTRNTVPEDYAQDTFLVKAFFSETEKYYIVMLTNMKQTWYEKLELYAIRERSKLIRSFAHEEDAQLEALLLSLSTVFITAHDTPAASASKTSAPPSKQILQGRHGKLYMIVGFEFGLATMSWKFKLSPMIASTSDVSRTLALKTAATFSQSPLFPTNLSQFIDDVNGSGGSGSGVVAKADANGNKKHGRRTFLEDSEDEYEDNGSLDFAPDDDDEPEEDRRNADGISVLFDHLVLPLITLNNAYRKQTRTLEAVIKNKESEVVEALELLEQHGIGYHNRRRVTERFDKARVDSKLQENAGENVNPSLSLLERNMASQEAGSSQSNSASRRAAGGESMSLLKDVGASVPTPTVVPAAVRNAGNADGGANSKAFKEAEELERRRALQEQLDKEKAEKERSRKKKKLF
ncbi:hypothetical protein BGZ97_000277 [Linnemannia gamsii]|uniref:Non-homologous end-joining factor 1 n=1 Tax=Linnemannia gamsii TaxID=64522 RepID=A0A9P6R3G9_9FUNG|nr:hypothetical protein BGZ97_000277 [Linnemannia gamsii]